jgi:hypothetical protein
MRYGALLVALILAVGVVAAVVALHDREADTQFAAQQRALAPVGAKGVERLLLTTSDPRPGYSAHPPARALSARCTSAGGGGLGNPWSCVVRYPRPPRIRYRVTVYADRSIFGSGEPEGEPLLGVLTVRGCCVASGTAP